MNVTGKWNNGNRAGDAAIVSFSFVPNLIERNAENQRNSPLQDYNIQVYYYKCKTYQAPSKYTLDAHEMADLVNTTKVREHKCCTQLWKKEFDTL